MEKPVSVGDGENGFGKYSLLNEFVRGLFSFRLESVQIPRFLKTNKQKSHMNSLTQIRELTSNLHLCLQVLFYLDILSVLQV